MEGEEIGRDQIAVPQTLVTYPEVIEEYSPWMLVQR